MIINQKMATPLKKETHQNHKLVIGAISAIYQTVHVRMKMWSFTMGWLF